MSAHIKRITEADLAKIDRNPNQPRKMFDPQSIKELAGSIKEVGLLQPIPRGKRGDTCLLPAANGDTAPSSFSNGRPMDAIVIEGENADEISLIENLQREDLKSRRAAHQTA